MFVRKLKNRSGSISVQVIRKDKGKYLVVKTIGTSHNPDKIEHFIQKAQQIIHPQNPYQDKLFALDSPNDLAATSIIDTLSNANIRTIGPELIFGKLFDRMGFNQIQDDLFRHLVISRLVYPTSKLKTIDYLYRYQGRSLSVNTIYAFLDRLQSRYKDQIEAIVYQNTQAKLKTVSVVFYDMTTLYFETEDEDDLRKIGFSKDGKFQHPQIMVGLLVGEQGLPIGYDLFEGNTFEGHTLLPALKRIQEKYGFEQPIVVADAAMLSNRNLNQLSAAQYQFIIGSRIKNECNELKQEILEKTKHAKDGDSLVFKRQDGTRLIVMYSDKRASKDARNRKKGLTRLEKRLKSGRLTKEHINNRGYNKFLVLDGTVSVRIDEGKIQDDQRWDGLKGYLTNTKLRPKKIITNYSHLWQIEKAFRISKTDLRVRPVYHFKQRRIEAHLAIAFVAYAIYKELELLLKKKNIEMSAKRASELTQTMYELHYVLPDSNEHTTKILNMDDEQKKLYDAIY